MRAGLFLAAVAASFVSFSSASAEEATAKPASAAEAAASTVTVAASSANSEPAAAAAVVPAVAPTTPGPASGSADAPSPPTVAPKPAPPTLIVKIDLSSQSMSLHYGGKRHETWKISSGREGYATPRGTYRPQWAARMWYSRQYDNAPMPHAVFFVGGVAVHGTQSTGLLGVPASHGCVRVAPGNASRFYALVHKHGYARTRIEVFGHAPASRIAKQRGPGQQWASSSAQRNHRASSSASGFYGGWGGPKPAPQVQRYQNGYVYLSPNSPYRGRETFVYNGVVYRRVR